MIFARFSRIIPEPTYCGNAPENPARKHSNKMNQIRKVYTYIDQKERNLVPMDGPIALISLRRDIYE